MKLNVMTFNVQHLRNFNYPEENRVEPEFFAAYVKERAADIVGLNEVFNTGKDELLNGQVFRLAEGAGYPYAYFAEATKLNGDAAYGNGMLSKYPFKAETVVVPDPDVSELNGLYAETRCVLRADYDFDGKSLTVLTAHFGLNDAEIKNAVQTVVEIVKSCQNPVILMGDFNAQPNHPLLQPLFELFTDTASLAPNDPLFTFPSNAPWEKIDYLLLKGEIKATALTLNRDVVADHLSMQIQVEF